MLVLVLARGPGVVVLESDVGIAGWTVVGQLPRVQLATRPELLDAPAIDRLAREEIALGVERDRVEEDEVACHVAGAAEAGEDRARPRAALHQCAGRTLIGKRERVVELPDDLVAAVDLEDEGLILVDGEIEVPSRSGRGEYVLVRAVGFTLGHARAGDHGDDLDRLADGRIAGDPDGRRGGAVRRVLLVHQDPIAGAVADVQVSVVTDDQAMGMAAVAGGEASAVVRSAVGIGAVHYYAAPVPEPLAVSVEDDHAVVAVPVRDVDAARLSGHRIRVG